MCVLENCSITDFWNFLPHSAPRGSKLAGSRKLAALALILFMAKKGGEMTHHYRKMPQMLIVHFAVMFAVMYTMVYSFSDVFINLNQFYMTMMMVLPMALFMPLMMKSMYPNKKFNLMIYFSSIVGFIILFLFMRNQTFVGDKQFLKSMIPHHSGAILMCERSSIADQEIKELCETIKSGQQKEIDQMKSILNRLGE